MEKKNLKSTNKIAMRITVAGLCLLLLWRGGYYLNKAHNSRSNKAVTLAVNEDALLENNYVPLNAIMELCGYSVKSQAAQYSYVKKDSGVDISVDFHFDDNKCVKNEYQFDLTEKIFWMDKVGYIQKDKLKEIINMDIAYQNGSLVVTPVEYDVHEWTTAFAPLVAHAGGIYREANRDTDYTNSLDTTIQNYNLGHRVFEFDFRLTTDGDLAVVHDWEDENGEKVRKTTAQWEAQNEVKGVACRTMLVDDVLDQMVINKDMFIITDTKTDKVGKNMEKQFQLIKKAAMERDPELLKRIIPQIYNMEMYEVVKKVHPFPSIIFTFYKTKETDDNLFDFVTAHDDIKVVATWAGEPGRFDLVQRLNEHGKLGYAHSLIDHEYSLNAYEDIVIMKEKGIYGFYTDYLLPRDWQTYEEVSKKP